MNQNLIKKHLHKLLKKFNTIHINLTPVQHKASEACGLFCLYFICLRLMNVDLDFKDFLNTYFSKNLMKNEKRVKKFALQ